MTRRRKRGYKADLSKLRANAAARDARLRAGHGSDGDKHIIQSNSSDDHTDGQVSGNLKAEREHTETTKPTVDAAPKTIITDAIEQETVKTTISETSVSRDSSNTSDDDRRESNDADETNVSDRGTDSSHDDGHSLDHLVNAAIDTGDDSADHSPRAIEIDEETSQLIEEALANSPYVDKTAASDGEEDEEWDDEALKTFDEMEEEDVLSDSDDSGAVRVLDSIVVYETENWLNEQTGKPYNRVRLRQQPPTIKFKQHVTGDETGEYDSEVKLVVTRKLAMQLGSLFNAIAASYDGRPIEDKNKQPVTVESAKKWMSDQWKYEPGKVIIVAVLAVLAIALGLYAKFIVH